MSIFNGGDYDAHEQPPAGEDEWRVDDLFDVDAFSSHVGGNIDALLDVHPALPTASHWRFPDDINLSNTLSSPSTLPTYPLSQVTYPSNNNNNNMPSAARRPYGNNVVDLTDEPSSPPRRIPSTSGPATTTKRHHADAEPASGGSSSATKRRRTSRPDLVDEDVDPTHEAPSAEEELLQAQQQETIRQQQQRESDDSGAQPMGKRSCVICMENYTNVTVTSCGHLYCYECLMQALLASEANREGSSGIGNCPVCRKPLSRNNKRVRHIIPISLMTKAAFEAKKAKDAFHGS